MKELMKKSHERENREMNDKIAVCLGKGGQRDMAEAFCRKTGAQLQDKPGDFLTVRFDSKGVSLSGFGLTYQGDFVETMLHRVTRGRLQHEMLAAQGYEVTLYEQNPVIAALLKDAIRRAKKNMDLKDIAGRMKVIEGNSVEGMSKLLDPVDVIYLDPMFPARQKSSLINKKLQLIQKLEPPCSGEKDLFDAAIRANPDKIIVKRPLKSECLAGREPSYTLKGKAIRYDCYVL